MLGAPAFGKGFGGVSVVLGVVGGVAACVLLVDPASAIAAVGGVFALIVFHLVLGWKVYRLSRSVGTNGGVHSYVEKENEKGNVVMTVEHNKT